MNNIDVITRAFRLSGVIAETETPSSEQADSALTSMNRMISRWQVDGIELDYYSQTSLSEEIPAPEEALDAIEYCLAKRLAGENGLTPPPTTLLEAEMAYESLVRATLDVSTSDLTHVPGSVRY